MKHVFVLTYNEGVLWQHNYPDSVVEREFKSQDYHFVILDNGNQPLMQQWAQRHGYTYYASEYNIGSSGGYNWIFKVAYGMGLDAALLMQADVETNSHEPLTVTYNLARELGQDCFFIWPQHLYNFWSQTEPAVPWVKERLHNLGNLVGFNPRPLWEKNCYFDENYVVTHFDDVEYLLYLDNTGQMQYKNVPALLNHCDHFYSNGEYPVPTVNSFTVRGPNYQLKIHHSSIKIDKAEKGIEDSHKPWYEFNKSIYDEFIKSGARQRLPYDASRWTRFGYPEYPVHYEIKRFFEQNPNLLRVDSKLWEIPNKPVGDIGT